MELPKRKVEKENVSGVDFLKNSNDIKRLVQMFDVLTGSESAIGSDKIKIEFVHGYAPSNYNKSRELTSERSIHEARQYVLLYMLKSITKAYYMKTEDYSEDRIDRIDVLDKDNFHIDDLYIWKDYAWYILFKSEYMKLAFSEFSSRKINQSIVDIIIDEVEMLFNTFSLTSNNNFHTILLYNINKSASIVDIPIKYFFTLNDFKEHIVIDVLSHIYMGIKNINKELEKYAIEDNGNIVPNIVHIPLPVEFARHAAKANTYVTSVNVPYSIYFNELKKHYKPFKLPLIDLISRYNISQHVLNYGDKLLDFQVIKYIEESLEFAMADYTSEQRSEFFDSLFVQYQLNFLSKDIKDLCDYSLNKFINTYNHIGVLESNIVEIKNVAEDLRKSINLVKSTHNSSKILKGKCAHIYPVLKMIK